MTLPMKFGVNWPFCSVEKVQFRFSTWLPGRSSCISIRIISAIFLSTSPPPPPPPTNTSYQISSRLAFYSGEEVQNRYVHCGGHIGFLIRTTLDSFDLQVTQILFTKFQTEWHSGSEKRFKIDLKDGSHDSHPGFLIRTILAIFDLQVTNFLPNFK